MKNKLIPFTLLATLLLLSITSFAQEAKEENMADRNTEVINQIKEMMKRYNLHRKKTSDIYKKHGYDSKQMIENETLIYEDDLQNREIAKSIFTKHGYPTYKLVGKERAHDYWVIVQNCNMDVDFQLAVLKITDKLIHTNQADPHDYAYLSDRVRINLGQKQIYGTQVEFNNNKNSYEPFELNDAAKVDERRAALNMEPMTEYIQKMNTKYEGTLKRKPKSRRYIRKP